MSVLQHSLYQFFYLAFNTYVLPSADYYQIIIKSGFGIYQRSWYIEQAVNLLPCSPL